MTLGDVRREPLPLSEEVRERVDRRRARSQCVVGPGEEFWSPGRDACPGVQQRDVGFAPVEGRIEGRQVRDLQREDEQTGQPGAVFYRALAYAARRGAADEPHCRADNLAPAVDPATH